MSLQEILLDLAHNGFSLGLDQVRDLFVFVYLYSQKPIRDESTNCLEARVRDGRVRYPIKLLQFEISNPEVLATVGKKIFETIDEKSSKLQQSSLKNFREENQEKLIALTKKTFHEISEIINLQCMRQQIPKLTRLPYGLFTPKKLGVRNFSTRARSQAAFFHKSTYYLPVSKVIKSTLSLIRR